MGDEKKMSLLIKTIRKHEQITKPWSGGATTQIAIYPENADYAKLNFKWRISSAKVNQEQSLFTHLPGIWRLIMILDGRMSLEHEGHYRVSLKPFEQSSFSGEWTTRSIGKAKDFNLMLAEGCKGELKAINIQKDFVYEYYILGHTDDDECQYLSEALYCIDGNVSMLIDGQQTLVIHESDLVLMTRQHSEEKSNIKLCNHDQMNVNVIRIRIFY